MIQLHTHRWDGYENSLECESMDSARANLQEAFASEIREHAGEIFSAYMNDEAAEIHRFDNSITILEIVVDGKPIPMDSTIHPDLQPEFSPM